MKEGLRIVIFTAVALFLTTHLVVAEEAESKREGKETQLKEIVVTPTGKIEDEGALKVPAVVETLTAEGIERINAIDTSDVFKYMPGSYLRKLYPGSTNSPLVIRGNNSTMTARTLVVADGFPISDFTAAGNSNAPKWQMVMPGEIESVDVIYGPFSAAFSGNSMSGTALITTHMPKKAEAEVDLTYTYQNFSEYESDQSLQGYTADAYLGDKIGRFTFAVLANRLETEAQGTSYVTKLESSGKAPSGNPVIGAISESDPQGDLRYVLGAQGVQDIKNNTVKVKLGYDLTPESNIRFTLAFWDSLIERDSPETYLLDANGVPVYSGNMDIFGKRYNLSANTFTYSKGEVQNLLYGLSYSYNPSKGLKVSATVSHYDALKDITKTSGTAPPLSKMGGAGTIQDNDNGWYTADLKGSYEIKGWGLHTIGSGYHFDRYYIDSETWNALDWRKDWRTTLSKGEKGKTETQALFVDDTWDINKNWSVYAGGRYEWWWGFDASKSTDTAPGSRLTEGMPYRSDQAFSPKLSATFKPDDKWRIRFSLGYATRYPTVGELYYGGISSSGIDNKANPDLKPERSVAKDITITRSIGKNGEARLTFFQDDVKDAIFSQTNTYTNVTNYQNVDEVRTRGVEIAVNMRRFFVDGLGFFANLAWTDSETRWNENVPESIGKWFPRVPRWRIKCVLDYSPSDRWFATLAMHYSSRQYGTLDNSDTRSGYGAIDKFLIFDTKVSYRVKDYLTATLGIDNITDQLYHVSHPYPRRTVFVDLKYTY